MTVCIYMYIYIYRHIHLYVYTCGSFACSVAGSVASSVAGSVTGYLKSSHLEDRKFQPSGILKSILLYCRKPQTFNESNTTLSSI